MTAIRTLLLLPLAAPALLTPAVLLPPPALANYSCEPGQPNCVPMDQYGKAKPKDRKIQCRVAGEPEALPDDLRFRNIGSATISAGTFVLWSLPHTGESGEFMIPRSLPPGASVPELDALLKGLEPNTPCKVRFLNS